MEPLPLEVDQSKIVPVLLGDKPAIAPPRPAARSKPVVVDEFPGKKYPPGTIPPEWFAWFEENMDRGVDANELLKILVSKGFQPAKCSRLMQFIAAHESLTVTSTMPVREESGQVVVVPTTATIIGTLASSSNLPPQWTAWLRDNIQMGVDKGLLFEILVKHGFEPAKNPLLVQALTQPHHEPSSVSRMTIRTQAAQEKVSVLLNCCLAASVRSCCVDPRKSA
jgi:NADH:ubiquinone oxidoreductase subunit